MGAPRGAVSWAEPSGDEKREHIELRGEGRENENAGANKANTNSVGAMHY